MIFEQNYPGLGAFPFAPVAALVSAGASLISAVKGKGSSTGTMSAQQALALQQYQRTSQEIQDLKKWMMILGVIVLFLAIKR